MTPRHLVRAAVLTGTAALALTACTSSGSTTPDAVSRTTAATTTTPTTTPARTPAPEDEMRIEIGISGERFTATLEDSPASRDLLAQLPVTVEMTDHGGVEKTGPLPSPLSLDGQPAGADPDVGDVGYYAPGGDVVLYYGDQSFFDGIVVLGRMEDDAAGRIAGMDGTVTVTFAIAGPG
ncbi:MAG TPA: cyclophilin-like fold protein [Ornithinibacter sp.]|nr:cyclophilin-like fold protein [Ornithinibacter sp.]